MKFISINSVRARANKQIIEDVAALRRAGWLSVANLYAFYCSYSVPSASYLNTIMALVSQ